MSRVRKKDSVLKYKCLFTGGIFLSYMMGRGIPLYGIDVSSHTYQSINAEEWLMQTIGGDMYRSSVFALGISPYMLSSLFVQLIVACKDSDARAKISPKKINRMTLAITLVLAALQALFRMSDLNFLQTDHIFLTKAVVLSEMVTGVMIILWLASRNKKYGIGGQTILIFVNILDGILSVLTQHSLKSLGIPILASAAFMTIVIFMENAEKRIPLQRISIHNIYADKNYFAIKLNPIGIMPVMFSTAFFILPQIISYGLRRLFPDCRQIVWLQENMTLTRPLGIAVYIVDLFLLTVLFSMLMIRPKDITEQFLKSGDCILNLHAGRDTRRYLKREVLRMSFVSAAVMGVCLGAPLVLQINGNLESSLIMLPSSVMMLTGICCSLYQEFIVIQNYDAYQPFL